jgi:hypothetical protein
MSILSGRSSVLFSSDLLLHIHAANTIQIIDLTTLQGLKTSIKDRHVLLTLVSEDFDLSAIEKMEPRSVTVCRLICESEGGEALIVGRVVRGDVVGGYGVRGRGFGTDQARLVVFE